MSIISQKIKNLRVTNKLSQSEFAEKTGVSRGYIQQLEKGTKFPSNKYLNKIEEVFNTPKTYFVNGEKEQIISPGNYTLQNDSIVKIIDLKDEKSSLIRELNFFYQRIVDLMMLCKEFKLDGMHSEINNKLNVFSKILHKYSEESIGVLEVVENDFELVDVFKNMSMEEKIEYLNKASETSKVFENTFYIYFNEIYNNLLKSYYSKLLK